ncbi:response regulator [Desulfovibrio aminophilus]|uniref:hybrid sensor histidine kinase/response regulator n=1 Tax=Desulfovibrio aminophilus TaxID=81425 RepID=UPI00339166B1
MELDGMAQNGGGRPPSILVVDDERVIGMALAASLARLGYSSAGLADNGEDAVRLCGEKRPDLVLMDVRLKGRMDGVEAAENINRQFHTPIIFLTAFWDEDTVTRAKSSGPYAFLVKPYEDRDLQTAIELALYKSRMERELLRAMRAAEAANEAKTSFLATISHELRTPLNGILGMTDLMLLSGLPEEHQENLELIKDSALSLLTVINQILDYSKIEARILELREGDFELSDVLDSVAAPHRLPASRKGLGLSVETDDGVPRALRGDHGRLRQILGHLLHNAVRYTAEGHVLVKAALCDASASDRCPETGRERVRLHFTVSDTGPGIPADRLGDIFESFTQVEDYMTRRHGGLGLGLATCRKLAALMGGAMWAESVVGRGSSFHFTAPFLLRPDDSARPQPATAQARPATGSLQGRHVVMAEDNLVNRRFVIRGLERRGCRVTAVENGRALLDLLAGTPCDLVLMDVQMPVLDGIEATRRIRAGLPGVDPALPIVALTAHALAGDEQWCLDAGMDAYVAKPVDIDRLEGVLLSTLAGKRPAQHTGDTA